VSIFITGVAGFVGANLTARLLAGGEKVVGFDNLCRGSLSNLAPLMGDARFSFQRVELADMSAYRSALKAVHDTDEISEIWHLAANSDIPAGIVDANIDFRDTFMTTFNTLELMKELKIGRIAFASSSAVYGDHGEKALSEDSGPLFPISNYGAMKLASEAAISAALESHLAQAWIFRFPNVIGVPATHGAIYDFVHKLLATPDRLEVLGDGTQRKSYLHVDDLIDAMLFIRQSAAERLACFNVGAADEGVTVRFIAEQAVQAVSPAASIHYGRGNKGWVGDVPRFTYSVAKLHTLGWRPRLDSAQAVRKAVEQIAAQLAGAGRG
jgi:UDP-glucose 4-epimerase